MVLSLGFFIVQWLYSHCQVPCGIFDDHERIKMMAENITTIEKAMKEIVELGKGSPVNYNQIVRWIVNKEYHAEQLNEIITFYFMAQRLDKIPITNSGKDFDAYSNKLILLHKLMVASMKAKQSTDLSHVNNLRDLLKQFETAYFSTPPSSPNPPTLPTEKKQ